MELDDFFSKVRNNTSIELIENEESYTNRHKREQYTNELLKKMQANNKKAFLYDEIYCAIYYADDRGDELYKHGPEIIKEASQAYETNDINTLDILASELYLPQNSRDIPYLTRKTLQELQLDYNQELDAIGLLSLLQQNIEAEIIYDVVHRNTWGLHSFKKGYNTAKKLKTRKRKLTNTYEHQLRFERHFLERLLRHKGVGINRAKKLSQILKFID